jgi:hypothetical protein
MSWCKPCQDEGRKQPAHRIVHEGGERIDKCRWHFEGKPHPAGLQEAPHREQTVPTTEKEMRMFPKSNIDVEKVKALHGQGLTDKAIAARLGCKQPAISYQRAKAGLAPNKRPGASAASKGARPSSKPRRAHPAPDPPSEGLRAPKPGNGTSNFVLIRVELLDAMWAQLEPEEKARLLNRLIPLEGDLYT